MVVSSNHDEKAIFLMSRIRKILLDPQKVEPRVGDSLARMSSQSQGGKSVIRLSLGRRSVTLLPVAQRTDAITNGIVDRPWMGRWS